MNNAEKFLSERLIENDTIYDRNDRIVGETTDILDEYAEQEKADFRKRLEIEILNHPLGSQILADIVYNID